MDSGRLEAFSDGVFAVAITPLALNLAVAARSACLRFCAGNIAYLVAIPVAFFSAPASLLVSGLAETAGPAVMGWHTGRAAG